MKFVLGQMDAEMSIIKAILEKYNVPFVVTNALKVASSEVYWLKGPVYFVECWAVNCDRERYPINVQGMGLPRHEYVASAYWEVSSLGRVLTVLHDNGIRVPEDELPSDARCIVAAKHSVRCAYAGAMPGVDPREFFAYRVKCLAQTDGVSEETVVGELTQTIELLRKVMVGKRQNGREDVLELYGYGALRRIWKIGMTRVEKTVGIVRETIDLSGMNVSIDAEFRWQKKIPYLREASYVLDIDYRV